MSNTRRPRKGCLAAAAFVFAVALLGHNNKPEPPPRPSSPVKSPAKPARAATTTPTLKTATILAANEEVMENANDRETLQVYMARGEAWVLEAGTKVKVTDRGFLTSSVMVLDGPHVGQKGLVVSEAVRP